MKIYNICIKISVLFFIFYSGECNSSAPLSSNSICKQSKDNSRIPFKRRVIYYSCKHRDTRRIRSLSNPYVVFAKDILRKYIYICNIVIIYILLNI